MSSVEGAEERFSALFRSHYDEVLRYALRRTDPAWAADAAAEVFVVAWRRLGEVPAEPLPWLIGTARLVLANQRRARQRTDRLQLRLLAQRPPSLAALEEGNYLRRRWSSALALLSPADQEVLALVGWDELSAREVAASLRCSVPAFTMRLHRARRRLSAALEQADAPPSRRGGGIGVATITEVRR